MTVLPVLFILLSRAGAEPTPLLRMPDIHGDQAIFICEGSLWVGSVKTGETYRLTSDSSIASQPKFSPDGSKIGFTAEYNGHREVYVIPTSGGAPQRITYLNRRSEMLDWSPDGRRILFRAQGPTYFFETWTAPSGGGIPTRFPLEFASDVSYSPDGLHIAFTRFSRSYEPWFGYEGGKKNDIWTGDLQTLRFSQAFSAVGTSEWPVWSPKGICFVNDENGRFSVRRVPAAGGASEVLAGPYPSEIRDLHSDGRSLIYERGTSLEILDLSSGAKRELQFHLHSDLRHTLPYQVSAQDWVGGASMSPNGQRVLVEARGHLLSLAVGEGAVDTPLWRPSARLLSPSYSPDGRRIAYISDESGEQQLYVASANGDSPAQITHGQDRQLKSLEWSPDGKLIALTDSQTRLVLVNVSTGNEKLMQRGDGWDPPKWGFSPDLRWLVCERVTKPFMMRALEIHDLETGVTTQLGDGLWHDFAPRFSTDGRFIAFLSRRNLAVREDPVQYQVDTQDVNKVFLLTANDEVVSPLTPRQTQPFGTLDSKPAASSALQVDGLYRRVIEVPLPARDYTQVEVNGHRVFALASGSLYYYDLVSKAQGLVTGEVDTFQISSDGVHLMLRRGSAIRVIESAWTDQAVDANRLSFGNAQLTIEPPQEWKEIYWDAWRLIRDYFFEPTMRGLDWKKVGDRYARYLPLLRSRDELNELIRWLLAELHVSHAYASGGDFGRAPNPAPAPGFLGAELTETAEGYYRISKIYTGDGSSEAYRSPLAEPGLKVKEGDYLISIGGVAAKPGSHFLDALLGRVGQPVELQVNERPSREGARTILIRPVESEQRMRYYEWVKSNRAYVNRISGGRIGYLHLPDLQEFGMEEFLKNFFPLTASKQAIIIDDRFGGGGFESENVIRLLNDKLANYFIYRNSEDRLYSRQYGAFSGPLLMVTNEFAGSNSEEIVYHFKKLKLGTVVGRRTWGGLVGNAPGWPLIDGGKVGVPNYGAFMDGKWIVEGRGVEPDVDVPSDPNEWPKGKDPAARQSSGNCAQTTHYRERSRQQSGIRWVKIRRPSLAGGKRASKKRKSPRYGGFASGDLKKKTDEKKQPLRGMLLPVCLFDRTRNLHLHRLGVKPVLDCLIFNGSQQRIWEVQLHDFACLLEYHHLRLFGVAIVHATREVTVHDTDVVNESHFLKGGEDSIDADHVDLAPASHYLLMNGIGAECGLCIGERANHLDSRHGDSITRGSQLLQRVLFISLV